MKITILAAFVFISIFLNGQQTNYFNSIYNPLGNYAAGRGIVTTNMGYICISGTENPATGYQSFLFAELNLAGDIVEQKLLSIDGHNLYPSTVGGYLKRTYDGNLAFTFQAQGGGQTYSSLVKLNDEFDTLWKRNYTTELDWTLAINWNQTLDKGFVLSGNALPQNEPYYDFLLIKTDSLGNEQWHQNYGTEWSEHGTNAIQTPDGGYLIGGYFWKPGTDHSMDAMVIKTDSLGNEQWVKYFGNPDIDDDMAFVQMTGDGNYLVATVYGEYIWTPDARAGRINIIKIDQNGEIIWDNKIGEVRYGYYMKNFKQTEDNNYIVNGWSEVIDSTIPFVYYPGWILKLNQNGDSLWFRDYHHFDSLNAKNYIYDVIHTSDNGYIAIGQSNEAFTQSNMWVIKLDSMGCDTPGCATGVFVDEFSPSRGGWGEVLTVFPNPTNEDINIKGWEQYTKGVKLISVFDIYGRKVKEITIPKNNKSLSIDVQSWPPGLYFLRLAINGKAVGNGKVVVE